jgi:hypothetical protein
VIDYAVTVHDSVAIRDNDAGDVSYGGVVILPAPGSSEVDAVTRFHGDDAPLSQAAWTGGQVYADPVQQNASLAYDPQSSSSGMPGGAQLTPGAANFAAQSPNPGVVEFQAATIGVDEDAGAVQLIVRRLLGAAGAASVTYTTVAGSAQPGSDYTTTAGTLNWGDGDATSRTISVPLVNDSDAEAAESFSLTLTAGAGTTAGPRSTATVNIAPSDQSGSAVVINEVLVNPPTSTDFPWEFAELRGTPGASLDGVYLAIASNATPGQVLLMQDLSGYSLGSSGLAVVKASSGGHSIPPETSVIPNTYLASSSITNDNLSFLLVSSPTTLTGTTDLDTDNNGALDLPAGASVLDAVGWSNSAIILGGVALTQGSGTADAATRFPSNLTPNSAAAWYNGDLLNNIGQGSVVYEGAPRASANQPAGAYITPGAANYGPVLPVIGSATFEYLAGHAIQLSGTGLTSLTSSSIVITNTGNGATLPTSGINLSTSVDGTAATITFTALTGTQRPDLLASGSYQLTIASASHASSFFYQVADFSHDGQTNFDDLLLLAQNYSQSPRNFGQGDANYDGAVNFDDLLLLAQNYNTGLSTFASAAPVPDDAGDADAVASDVLQ